ncbi:sigma-54 dependent transcriptional regulator [Betaproteobacteria bacterium]|nr:sigma-54 dependent transcriptional regulator [Betaproteobacteria bacterium]
MINSQILGNSSSVIELKKLIDTVAVSDTSVLISGESGTGKELIAKNLHSLSRRSRHKFIAVNCAAIPRDLIESELFGHKKGSFTGAIGDRLGRFELANGGTLFLDEIGDLPQDVQVKLLRVLQERVIDPIGSIKPKPIDVRIISATHKDLESEILSGGFREDLFYRLNVLPIISPPLRERRADIVLLFEHFSKIHSKNQMDNITLAPCLVNAFESYNWPGNIRELSNISARLTTLYPGKKGLRAVDVPETMLPSGLRKLIGTTQMEKTENNRVENLISLAQGNDVNIVQRTQEEALDNSIGSSKSLKEKLAEFEIKLIKQALIESEGNVTKTARTLNVQRTTLIEKINKYSINLT